MKFAAKLLTQSDLTLFAAYYRQNSTSKQKGINLNGDVLAGRLFPALPTRLTTADEIPVTLDIYGPGGAGLQRFRRKIVKSEGGKNWRLNGKLIEEQPETGRFSSLAAGDVGVLAFDGGPLPESVSLVLLSQHNESDAPLRAALIAELNLVLRTKSMAELSLERMTALAGDLGAEHPFRLLLPDPQREADLIGAAEGDTKAEERLSERVRRRRARPVSIAELDAARARSTAVGRAGEVLVNALLERDLASGVIARFTWEAEINAVNAWDFTIAEVQDREFKVDVKSTTGTMATPFHISASEISEAVSHSAPYQIYRVYGIDGPSIPRLRRSDDITPVAKMISAALSGLPSGITIGSVEVDPSLFTWGQEETLTPVAEDDDDS